jgi:hypothetical protein
VLAPYKLNPLSLFDLESRLQPEIKKTEGSLDSTPSPPARNTPAIKLTIKQIISTKNEEIFFSGQWSFNQQPERFLTPSASLLVASWGIGQALTGSK